MFNVKINIEVEIKDCPKSGLGAVDFRRKTNLPEGPTNKVRLDAEFRDEAVCRHFGEFLNASCDLDVSSSYDRPNFGNLVSSVYGDGVVVKTKLIKKFLSAPDRDPIPLLETIRDEVKRIVLTHEEKQRACSEEEKKREAESKRKHEEEISAQTAWVMEHGSELLRERLANGFEWVSLFEREFAQATLDGIELGKQVDSDQYDGWDVKIKERNTPLLHEIKFLKQARSQFVDKPLTAELVWVTYTSDDGESKSQTELLVTVTCPTRREIVYYFVVT